jgi:hypothetical protein
MSQRKIMTVSDILDRLKARMAKHVFGIDRFALIVVDLYQRAEEATTPYKDVRVQRITPEDMPDVIAVFPDRERVFNERFATRCLEGWLIFVGDTLIGFIWFAIDDYYEKDIRRLIRVPRDHIFSLDFLVAKDKRFGLAAHHAIWQIMDHYKTRSYVRCDNLVNVNNRKSLMFHTFLGSFDTLTGVDVLRVLGWPVTSWEASRTTPLIKQRHRDKSAGDDAASPAVAASEAVVHG